MPKLSVIVPVYNTEKYLRVCIDSILAQTFTDFELILVDDGSEDSSGSICDEYAAKDTRVQVIHQTNGGVTNARKNGVRRACGKYFSFIDSDDWIHPEMFERMVEKCVEANADVVVCDVRLNGCGKVSIKLCICPLAVKKEGTAADNIDMANDGGVNYTAVPEARVSIEAVDVNILVVKVS